MDTGQLLSNNRPQHQREVSCVYEELTRSMNAAERRLLDVAAQHEGPAVTLAETLRLLVVWSGGLLLCVVVVGVLIWFEAHPVLLAAASGPFGLAGAVCLYAIIMVVAGYRRALAAHRDFVGRQLPQIEAALADGRVAVKRVAAQQVIELVEFEDEGGGFIFDVGDGRLLFLKGQEFEQGQVEQAWPNSEFEIVRTVRGDRWLGIFCTGDELTPLREIDTSDCRDEIVWAHREQLVEGELEQFARSITKVH